MKVHHITEAPRIEPPRIGGTVTAPSGPTVSSGSKPATGITGTKAAFANKNGGVSKGTVVGPAKNGNPNQVSFKDSKGKTFNVSIKKLLDPKKLTPLNIGLGTSTTTATPKADAPKADLKADPKPNVKADNIDTGKSKPQGKIAKLFKGGIVGAYIGIGVGVADFYATTAKYRRKLEQHAYNTKHSEVEAARGEVAVGLANSLSSILVGIAAGTLAATKATRVFLIIPGWGWLASLISGGVGFIAAAALQVLATKTGAMDFAAEFMMKRVDHKLLQNITDDVEEEVDTKGAMKQAIMSDPKLIKAFKLAKEMKATKAAS